MTEYIGKPRQGTYSEYPMFLKKPRRFARTRCENTLRATERIMLYMGELLQLYNTQDIRPDELCAKTLEVVAQAAQDNIGVQDLIYYLEENRVEGVDLGKYPRLIVLASLIQQTASDLRNTILELYSSI